MALSARAADRGALLAALAFGGAVAICAFLLRGPQVALPLAAVAAGMLALFNRRAALYVMLPAITLSPDIPIHGLAIRLEDLLMLPLTAGWLANLCVTGRRRATPLDRILIAYVLVAMVSTAWGTVIGTVHLFTVSKYLSTPFFVLKRIEFVLMFFIVADTLETLRDVRTMSYVFLGSAVALSLYSVQQLMSNQAIALGPEGAPIHEPGFASMVTVALALGMMRGATGAGRIALAAIALFGVATLPLALGRNYMAATLLVLGYVAVREQRWMIILVPLLAALALVVYPHGIVDRISSLTSVVSTATTSGPTSTASASLFFRAAAPFFYAAVALGHSPLLGMGMGSVPLGAIDSEFVIQLYYTGLVGLTVFVLFGVRLWRLAQEAQRLAVDPMDSALAYSFQLVLAGYAIYSVFASSISATHTGEPFFVMVGLVAALRAAVGASRERGLSRAVPASAVRAPGMRAAAPRIAARQALWLRNPIERRTAP